MAFIIIREAARSYMVIPMKLNVTVQGRKSSDNFIKGQGIMIEFKELKACVLDGAIKGLDHKLILSKEYLLTTKGAFSAVDLLSSKMNLLPKIY